MTTDDLTTAQTAAETSRPVAPRIAVRLFAGAAAAFGADATTVHAATLEEVIAVLRRDGSAEAGRVIDRSSFLVNAVACTDRARMLADGDRVDVLPPFAGG
ncbi:MAG TPA: MoaD/ThiS family protein [Brachybacterium sp.]|nr:MoaD/ThiS family protein [Brachybacterium sp.]